MKRIIGTVVCLVAILIVLANSYHTISDTSNVPPLDVTQVAQPAATAEQNLLQLEAVAPLKREDTGPELSNQWRECFLENLRHSRILSAVTDGSQRSCMLEALSLINAVLS